MKMSIIALLMNGSTLHFNDITYKKCSRLLLNWAVRHSFCQQQASMRNKSHKSTVQETLTIVSMLIKFRKRNQKAT